MKTSDALLKRYERLGLCLKQIRAEIETTERALALCQLEHKSYYKRLLVNRELDAAEGELELRRLHQEIEELQKRGL